MVRYKVKVPFVDFGIHHAVDSIIADVTLIGNKDVRLWDGTIVMIDDNGKEIPFKKIPQVKKTHVISPKQNPNTVIQKAEKVEVPKAPNVITSKQPPVKEQVVKNQAPVQK